MLLRRLRPGQSGQSLVEMALIAPVLVFLLALTAEVGRSFYVGNQVTNAAREGALWAGHHFQDTSGTGSNPGGGCGQANTSYSAYKANIVCVIQSEESSAFIGCPVSQQSTPVFTPDPTSGSAPFNVTWGSPPPNTHGSVDMTIVVNCNVKPLLGLPPLRTTYTVAAKVTTFVFY
jgi:Flp pilus assembly protein TadG